MTQVRTRARSELEAIGRQVSGRVRRSPGPPRVRRRWIIVAVVAVLVVAAGWVIAFSSVLAVSRVQVDGVHRMSAVQVLAQARVPDGMPLVRVPRGAIERRVEKLPDVLRASVSISFPATVVIKVTERTASGALQLNGGGWGVVDETGYQFNTVAAKPAGLPVLAPAAWVANDRATLAAMAQVAVSVPDAVRPKLIEVTATDPQDVTLVLADQRLVVWGASERNAEKARVLPALLERPGWKYNVSNPDLPYTRTN